MRRKSAPDTLIAVNLINWSRVILGGLLAGVVCNVSGITFAHFVLGPEYIAAFKQKFPSASEAAMALQHISLRMWFGLLAVFLYAAFRPRFGPGPATALIAGATLFASVGVVLLLSLHQHGLLAGWKLAVTAVWTLAELCIAALAGSWLYRQ